MHKKFFKNILFLLIVLLLTNIHAEADRGNFYKIPNSPNLKGLRGLASAIAVPYTSFRYTPGRQKIGILDDLALTDYAVSQDNSTMALAESQAQDDGTFLNRIIFFEYGGFRIINGIEYTAKEKLEKIFFFAENLFCITHGEKTELKMLILSRNLKFSQHAINLETHITGICSDKTHLFIKNAEKKMWQFDEELKKIASIETRHNGGVIFLQPGTDKIINFTKENIEIIQQNNNGLFKSSFYNLQDAPEPLQAWIVPSSGKSIFFVSTKGTMHELINYNQIEDVKISRFQQIFYHPQKREFYILSDKKHIIEILRPADLKIRRKISHSTMRPESNRNIKFMFSHPRGLFLITQQGEFVFIRENKRRFYKTKF